MTPAVSDDPVLAAALTELSGPHGAHTILLYGSRANGTAGPDSDYDVVGFAPVDATRRIARDMNGRYLDLFVYPEAVLSQPAEEHLRLRGSLVLRQRGREGDTFLGKLDALHRAGPPRLASDEVEARKVWAHKMLDRLQRGDAEGDYRRAWLLQALLEDYFHLRGLWYEGPKKALRQLAQEDAETHRAFCAALKPAADVASLRSLVERVTGRRTAGTK